LARCTVHTPEYPQGQPLSRGVLSRAAQVPETRQCLPLPAAAKPAPAFAPAFHPQFPFPKSNMAPFNLTGLPTLALPCGFSASGLPVSFQLSGRPFEEATVLRAGHAYEQATTWHTRRPPV